MSVALLPAASVSAAVPVAGTLSPNGPNVTWTGDKIGGAAPNAEADCADTAPGIPSNVCDTYTLTLGGTLADWTNKRARVQASWATMATDYDMYVHTGSPERHGRGNLRQRHDDFRAG